MGTTSRSYDDLDQYCRDNPQFREKFVALSIGIDPVRFSKLKTKKWSVAPNEEELPKLAALLNQTPEYVRNLYRRAA